MATFKLKAVTLRSWTRVRDAHIEFPDKGLVWVSGKVGCGKSALGEAISRSLFGVEGRFSQLSHYFLGERSMYVETSGLLDGKPLSVKMGYRAPEISPAGEGLLYTLDKRDYRRDTIANTRFDLNRLLGVSTALASWAIHMDCDTLDFSALSQKDAVDLFLSALVNEPLDAHLEKAAKTLAELKTVLATTEALHAQAKDTVNQLQIDSLMTERSLAAAQQAYAAALAKHESAVKAADEAQDAKAKELQSFEDRKAALKKQIDARVAANAEAEHQAEIDFNTAADEAHAAALVATEKSGAATAALQKLGTAQVERQALADTGRCPTCGHTMGKCADANSLKQYDVTIASLQQKAAAAQKAESEALAAKAAAAKKKEKASAALKALREANSVADLSEQYEHLDIDIRVANRALVQLERQRQAISKGVPHTAVDRAESAHEAKLAEMAKASAKLEQLSAELVENQSAVKVASYWHTAFGPTGIPNMLLREAMGPMRQIASRIAYELNRQEVQIEFNGSRTLASGSSRAELNISVINTEGCSRLRGGSKGERRMANMLLAETLAEVGRTSHKIGYRWYDELLVNQHADRRKTILSYLKRMADERDLLIFVIGHDENAKDYADHILHTEKVNGFTSYRWVS